MVDAVVDAVTGILDANSSKFFQEHMEYIANDDIEGMVRQTYTENATYYNTFAFLSCGGGKMVQGQDAIIKTFREYMEYQGIPKCSPPFNYIETKDFITFQTILECKSGKWGLSDVWSLEGGKIAHHLPMAYKIEDLLEHKM